MSIAESREAAKTPRRPMWAESDRGWRRRMIFGLWVLVLIPLPKVLEVTRVGEHIPLPSSFGQYDPNRNFADNSFLWFIDPCLTFFIGAVLLFGRERGRRRHRRDWLKRWGIFGTSIVTFVGLGSALVIAALVGCGIAALIHSMPLAQQSHGWYGFFSTVSVWYLHYGPYPTDEALLVQICTASAVMILACSPLHDALRARGSNALAWILPAPLAVLGFAQIVAVIGQTIDPIFAPNIRLSPYFLDPSVLNGRTWDFAGQRFRNTSVFDFAQEGIKWLTMLMLATTLSVAQVKAIRGRKIDE